MNEETRTGVPVPGDVIPRSTVKAVGGILFVTLIFFASAFIVWAYFTESALPLPSAEVRVNGLGAILAGLYDTVRVEGAAAMGTVRISLAFDDWQAGSVAPATFELQYPR